MKWTVDINGKKYKLIGNEIVVLISIGIIGFFYAALLLFGKGCTSTNSKTYQEIIVADKAALIKDIQSTKLTQLRSVLTDSLSKDPSRILQMQRALSAVILDSIYLANGNADTSVRYFTKILLADRRELMSAIISPSWNQGELNVSIPFVWIDSNTLYTPTLKAVKNTLHLQTKTDDKLINYFSRNPATGFWIIFSMAQMVLWCLVIPILYSLVKSVRKKVTGIPASLVSYHNWGISSIIPFVFLTAFGLFFYQFLIDDFVIKDHYFLSGFNTRMLLYAVPGYLATIGCFAMFLLMSMTLDAVNNNATELKLQMKDDAELKKNYQVLKKTFDNTFLLSAFILSFFVLWTGLLFTAVNQTEAMRFYKAYAGTDFLPYDNVYLIGAMHTLVLLLFYLPVRLKFNSLQLIEEEKIMNSRFAPKMLGSLYEAIMTLLLTASPLLTGVLQKIISGFFP